MSALPQTHRFSITEYEQMGQAGIFGEDDRVELIAGEIWEMAPIGSEHAGQVNELAERFFALLLGHVTIAVQNPVQLDDRSLPQPDILILQRRPDYYRRTHPVPSDVLLLIEVADSSVAFDRSVKALLYARAGIVDYWVFDLPRQEIVVHRDPSPEGYRQITTLGREDRIALSALPEIELAVDELLGSSRASESDA